MNPEKNKKDSLNSPKIILGEFMSLREASDLSGYHKDYLGQLIRKNNLYGVRKGHSWFTTQEAIYNYLFKNNPERLIRLAQQGTFDTAPIKNDITKINDESNEPTEPKVSDINILQPNVQEKLEKESGDYVKSIQESVTQNIIPTTESAPSAGKITVRGSIKNFLSNSKVILQSFGLFALVGILLVGVFLLIQRNDNEIVSELQTIPIINIERLIQIGERDLPRADRLLVNGTLEVSGPFILDAIARPDEASLGQLYFDESLNQLFVYNGTDWLLLLEGDEDLLASFVTQADLAGKVDLQPVLGIPQTGNVGITGTVLAGLFNGEAAALITTGSDDIDFTLSDSDIDSNFNINTATGSIGFTSIRREDGGGDSDPDQLLLVDNLDIDRPQPIGLKIQSAAGGINTAIDISDADIVEALDIGDNTIAVGGGEIEAIELVLLDGRTGTLVDSDNISSFALTDIATGSGMEILQAGLTLLATCNSGELLKWDATSWSCGTDRLGGGGGSNDTLESAYRRGNTITTTDSRDIEFNLADTTIDSSFIIDILGTGNVFEIRDEGTVAFSVLDGGNIGVGTIATNELLTLEGIMSFRETTAPTNTANYGKVYVKSSDGELYYMDDLGAETNLIGSAGVTGSGSAGQISFWSGASTISGDSNLFWDDIGKYLGFGTNTPSEILTIADGGNALFESGYITTPFGGFGRYENYLTYSEQYDNVAWTTSGMSAIANTVASPDGATTADSLLDDAAPGGTISQSTTSAAGETWTYSVWMKGTGAQTVILELLDDGVPGNTTNSITLGTTWKRYSVTHTASAGTANITARINHTVSAGSDTFYAWGGQLEKQSNVGLYAITTGTVITSTGRGFIAGVTGPHLFFGNVGIGSTSPNELLTLEGVLSFGETTAPTNTANYGKVYVKGSDNNLYYMDEGGTETNLLAVAGLGGTGSAGQATFWVNGTTLGGDNEFFWDDGSNFLGLGTSSPAYLLDVARDARISGELLVRLLCNSRGSNCRDLDLVGWSRINSDGMVNSFQKISDTQGGLTESLEDSDNFGTSLSFVNDLDLDGIVDLGVGVRLDDDGGTNRGAAYILFLNRDGTIKSEQKISDTAGGFTATLDDSDNFGNSISTLGNLDTDNIYDIAVGALNDDDGGDNRGAVYVLFMNTNGTVSSFQKISDTAGGFTATLEDDDIFGSSVAHIRDLDSDGVNDIIVGAPGDDDGGDGRGAVYVLFMNTNGTVSSFQKISDTAGGFTATLEDGDGFGESVALVEDINQDGVQDIAVGAQFDDDGGFDKGAIYILFMNSDGTVSDYQKISDTEGDFTASFDNSDYFGSSISGAGDFNGDGMQDILVGARLDDDGGTDRGAGYILFMNSDGKVKNYQKISDTEGGFSATLDDGDNLGSGITSMGDLNTDGIEDIVLGARADSDGGTSRGAVYVTFLNKDNIYFKEGKVGIANSSPTELLTIGDGAGSAGNILLSKQNVATAGTQYPSNDLIFESSIWDTTGSQAEDRRITIRNTSGSGANGSEPYRLSFLDNSGNEFVTADGLNNRIGVSTSFPQERLTLGPASTFATEISVPTSPSATCNTSGGSLADATYYFKITASDNSSGTTSSTESTEASCTISGGGGAGSVDVSWTASSGAASYRIYKGTSSDGEDRYFVDALSPFTYTTDTGATMGSVPTITDAYVVKFASSANSYVLGVNFGVGDSTPDAVFDVDGNSVGFAGGFFNDGNNDDREGIFIQACLDLNPTGSCNFIEFRDGSGGIIGAVEGDGGGGVTNASAGSDYAELFPGDYNLFSAGDILGVDGNGSVVLASDTSRILGAFSTSPNTLGNWKENWKETGQWVPVGLLGQIYVNVVNEKGDIKAGDKVTVSSVDGVAAKASQAGRVIGTALEDFSCSLIIEVEGELTRESSCSGKIKILVNPHWWAPSNLLLAIGEENDSTSVDLVEENYESIFADTSLASIDDIFRVGGMHLRGGLLALRELFVERLFVREIAIDATPPVFKNHPTIGSGSISSNLENKEIFIENDNVKINSKIFITLTELDEKAITIAVLEKEEGRGFLLGVSSIPQKEISFDYWIVNVIGKERQQDVDEVFDLENEVDNSSDNDDTYSEDIFNNQEDLSSNIGDVLEELDVLNELNEDLDLL